MSKYDTKQKYMTSTGVLEFTVTAEDRLRSYETFFNNKYLKQATRVQQGMNYIKLKINLIMERHCE